LVISTDGGSVPKLQAGTTAIGQTRLSKGAAMPNSKRILIVGDVSYNPVKMFLSQVMKLTKGFIRLGNDVRIFSYYNAITQASRFKSKTLSVSLYKSRADELLAKNAKSYQPDIVLVSYPRAFDAESAKGIRNGAPDAVIIGVDGDPWPKLQKGRIETALQFDILMAMNDGQWLQDYRDAGVQKCVFIPNVCDPDSDHRYEVEDKWQSDILWTGTAKHNAASPETLREDLVAALMNKPNVSLYGCFDRPQIGGLEYLYAISGARIGVNVSADNSVRLYHSDRLIHYLACGTFVLAKRFPDSNLLYEDGKCLRYFDTIEEFFDLADYYLSHEQERRKTADAGMAWAHKNFNCEKIAGYILELAQSGRYSAPWYSSLSTAKSSDRPS
jgi:hypothetical protein